MSSIQLASKYETAFQNPRTKYANPRCKAQPQQLYLREQSTSNSCFDK